MNIKEIAEKRYHVDLSNGAVTYDQNLAQSFVDGANFAHSKDEDNAIKYVCSICSAIKTYSAQHEKNVCMLHPDDPRKTCRKLKGLIETMEI